MFGEVGYNVYHVGRVHGFSTVSKRSGSYSYRLSVYSSGLSILSQLHRKFTFSAPLGGGTRKSFNSFPVASHKYTVFTTLSGPGDCDQQRLH
ncbi:MAG: hypothetical protein RMI04_09675, partial [Thermofilaceae archaeon]|nr:hypothetical protein [Thermofilaceae archaeon]